MEATGKKAGLVLLMAMLLASGALGSIGVIQDYMEDEVVLAPRGKTTCHRIWLSTSPTVEHGQAKLVLNPLGLPDFVEADLRGDGIYNTTKGSSEAIIFYITPPTDDEVGGEYRVNFLIEGMEVPEQSGMVTLVGKIGSGFVIRVADSGTEVPNRCGQLPRTVNLPPECGDDECNGDETCETCREDCGECPKEVAQEESPKSEGPKRGDDTLTIVIIALVVIVLIILLRFWNISKRKRK